MTGDRISGLRALIAEAEETIADRQDALTLAASDLARTVGPLAAAHRLAELALELASLAKAEGARE